MKKKEKNSETFLKMPNLKLDKWQEDFLNTTGDKILCTGRQVGKSVTCARDAALWAIKQRKPSTILMIAPTERQAYELFDKTLSFLMENYHPFVKMGKDRPTKKQINLKNNVKILCLPTGMSGTGIRGLTVHRLYVDEASRVPEEVWSAITPMLLTTGGDCIYLSTPKGKVGEFYRCWINKDNAYNSFTRFSVTSEEVIKNRPICETWSEIQKEKALNKMNQERARMSNKQYAQEYVGEFMDDLYRYFSDELIFECCTQKRRSEILKDRIYFLGCDIARMGEDEGTFEILHKIDQNHIVQVENIVTRKQLTTQTENRIIELDKKWNFKGIAIDAGSGSLGVGIFDHLLENEQVKRKVEAINNRARSLDRYDKSRTKLMKEDLYDNLRSLMEKGIIKLLDDDELIESLRSVQYEYIVKDNEPTRMRIFGDYTHIVEGLIRAAYQATKNKNLNIWMRSIKV